MNCDVCLSSDFDGPNEFERCTTPKARKEHKCEECRKVIAKGEVYERFTAKWDGAVTTTKTCLLCAEISTVFYCNGRVLGNLWGDMADYVFDRLTVNSECFLKLSAAAKEKVLDRWRKWKGLDV